MYFWSTWRAARPSVIVLYDSTVAFASVLIAYHACIGRSQFATYLYSILLNGSVFAAMTGLLFIRFRLYASFWRFSSLVDLEKFLQATLLVFIAYRCALFVTHRLNNIPWSIPLVQLLLFVCLSLCPRFGLRFLREKYRSWAVWRRHRDKVRRVLLIGAGEGAAMLLRAFRNVELERPYVAVGILDITDRDVGRNVFGVPILGSLIDFDRVMKDLHAAGKRPRKIVITIPLRGTKLLELQTRAEQFDARIYRTPSPTDFQPTSEHGGIDLTPIAAEDLLERQEVKLETTSVEGLIEGRCILVTGAGGSIGGELCRQIARRNPGTLVLVDANEYNLYAISMSIGEQFRHLHQVAHLADIRNAHRIEDIFLRHSPEIVFHAAALKHVPLCEDNPSEGAYTNVVGTRNVAEAALSSGALAFVQVSTDKAVNPTSVMGATKRMAEVYCQSLDHAHAKAVGAGADCVHEPRFITVRFGNVLGSSGSILPLFRKQLQQGGPLTVTHPDMERFFMSIREAVELVLQGSARALWDPANRGHIFVLDMGQPVNILDFAERMTRLAGLQPYKDIRIEFIGMRPGEKLREELFGQTERRLDSGVDGILVAKSNPIQLSAVRAVVQKLEHACMQGNDEAVLRLLEEHVSGYRSGRPVAPIRLPVQTRKVARVRAAAHSELAEGSPV